MQAFYVDSVDSTNTLARSMLREGAITGRAYLVAREQTGGRGTRGRSWSSPRDAGLYLTVIDRPNVPAGFDLSLFTLAAGVAGAEVIRELTGIEASLKPINDLYVNGRKLGGILTEADIVQGRVDALRVGVGLNVRAVRRDVADAAAEPISMEEIMDAGDFQRLDLRTMTVMLVRRMFEWIDSVTRGEVDSLRNRYAQYAVSEPDGLGSNLVADIR